MDPREIVARALEPHAQIDNRFSLDCEFLADIAVSALSYDSLTAELSSIKARMEALEKALADSSPEELEQNAFEAWAASNGYDMDQHPLHWLFLNEQTNTARQGWKGALAYARAVLSGDAG